MGPGAVKRRGRETRGRGFQTNNGGAAPVRLELADGPELYLKLEALQPIGSFKIRGAYNVVRQLTPEQLALLMSEIHGTEG